MTGRMTRRFELSRLTLLLCCLSCGGLAFGQGVAPTASPGSAPLSSESADHSLRELREQVRELQAAVAGMRSEWQRAREETAELRREVAEIRAVGAGRGSSAGLLAVSDILSDRPYKSDLLENAEKKKQDSDSANLGHADEGKDRADRQRDAKLDEEYQLLSGKVDDQYQTKVESASKYRLRLSGIVLMNLASNQGVVDSVDVPTLAYARPAGGSGGSFGATLRQSEIGLETFGPDVAGARTRADLQLDLAGGFSSVPNGASSGLMRLRTATVRLDWANTSVVAGQDSLFISPESPTSFATLAIPALSYAGNLWSWAPQVRVEHRVALGEDSSLLLQGGILDPQSGALPGSSYESQAGPGEASRQPAYGARTAWTRKVFRQTMQVGAAGYHIRQNYGFERNVDGWAGMTDFELPLSRQFSLSGKFYRGKALGGLYGGLGQSALFSGDPSSRSTAVRGLNTIGGWAQLKYRLAVKWEMNAAFGTDNPHARDLKFFVYPQSYLDATLARNQAGFVNMIYRPRSDLLFSAEYRHLTTHSLADGASEAGHLNLMVGVVF